MLMMMITGMKPAIPSWGAARRCCSAFAAFAAACSGGNFICSMIASAPAMMLPELRQDRVLDDQPRHGVGQEDTGAVAGLDSHLLLVRRDEQDDAVVALLVANLPVAAKLVAIFLDRAPLEALHRRDDELSFRGGFQGFGLAFKIELLLGPKQASLIHHTAGQRREVLRRSG